MIGFHKWTALTPKACAGIYYFGESEADGVELKYYTLC